MEFLQRSFGALTPAYLFRAYVIGIGFFLWMGFVLLWREDSPGYRPDDIIPLSIIFALCTLLFPFSKLVWDELKHAMLGDNIIILPLLVSLVLKLVVNGLLWGLAIFIAPFGLIYLWLRTR